MGGCEDAAAAAAAAASGGGGCRQHAAHSAAPLSCHSLQLPLQGSDTQHLGVIAQGVHAALQKHGAEDLNLVRQGPQVLWGWACEGTGWCYCCAHLS